MLTQSLKRSLKRAKCSLAFLHSVFSLSGVSRDDRPRVGEAVRQVLQLSARGERTIHVGKGCVVGSGKVSASALEGESYEVIWSRPTEPYPDESQLWVLLWTSLSASAALSSRYLVFKRSMGKMSNTLILNAKNNRVVTHAIGRATVRASFSQPGAA